MVRDTLHENCQMCISKMQERVDASQGAIWVACSQPYQTGRLELYRARGKKKVLRPKLCPVLLELTTLLQLGKGKWE